MLFAIRTGNTHRWSFIFYKYFDQVIWSLMVNSILQITSTFITFVLIFVILKLHILFGYCVAENGVSFPWSTNQEPLLYFMHGRSSHLSLHIITPPQLYYILGYGCILYGS